MGRIRSLLARVQGLRPVRVFQHYSTRRGPLLASGLAYQALFAIFAAIWVLFSVVGLVLAGDRALTDTLVSSLGNAVPGLIDTGDGSGAIDPRDLLQTATFSWTGIVALLATLLTALGFLGSTRSAIRSMYGLPDAGGNPVLAKAIDLGWLVGLAALLLVSTALSIGGTAATSFMLGLVGVGSDSPAALAVGRIVSLVATAAVNTVAVGLLLSAVARARLAPRAVWQGAVLGGVGTTALVVLFQLGILGGASSNPLLASFVVILGLLVFFNFLCQVLLIAASWVAVGRDDAEGAAAHRRQPGLPRGARPGVPGPVIRREG
jgi:membrane protein